MIQRKQSVFLFLAVVANIICFCMPVGKLKVAGIGVDTIIYNLCTIDGNGTFSFVSAPLFVLLAIETIITFATIFLYKNRKRQITLCKWAMFLLFLWYVAYAVFAFMLPTEAYSAFNTSFAAVLPLVNILLVMMAKRGIKADEALVRASERLR